MGIGNPSSQSMMPRMDGPPLLSSGLAAGKHRTAGLVPLIRAGATQLRASLALVALILSVMLACGPARAASPNDVARYLAGLEPASGSPLQAITSDPQWQLHASEMDRAWSFLEANQINRVRVWARANLPPPRPAMFYMFSGPDFLHAEAFYPDASVYVLSGLEPLGAMPDLASIPPAQLQGLRASLNNFVTYGYFITKEMGQQFDAGTLPVLYVFLARAGKFIQNVTYIRLTGQGTVSALKSAKGANGVQIIFSDRGGRPQKLYYFRTDLSDGGVAKSGFLKFCASLGTGDSLVKSASYLMHTGGFSKVRDFLLSHSAAIIQDDSGIALRYFDPAKWQLLPFGQYLAPIDVFKERYQPEMAQLFQRAQPINFGIGYRWHPTRTNVLLAIRGGQPAPASAAPHYMAPPAAMPQAELPPPEEPRRVGPLRRLFGGGQ